MRNKGDEKEDESLGESLRQNPKKRRRENGCLRVKSFNGVFAVWEVWKPKKK